MEVPNNLITDLVAHQAERRGGYRLLPPALTQLKMPGASSAARAQDQLMLDSKAEDRVFLSVAPWLIRHSQGLILHQAGLGGFPC